MGAIESNVAYVSTSPSSPIDRKSSHAVSASVRTPALRCAAEAKAAAATSNTWSQSAAATEEWAAGGRAALRGLPSIYELYDVRTEGGGGSIKNQNLRTNSIDFADRKGVKKLLWTSYVEAPLA